MAQLLLFPCCSRANEAQRGEVLAKGPMASEHRRGGHSEGILMLYVPCSSFYITFTKTPLRVLGSHVTLTLSVRKPILVPQEPASHGCPWLSSSPTGHHPRLPGSVWVKHHGRGFCPCYVGKELAVRHTPTYCLSPFVLTWLCSKNSTNRPSSWRLEWLAGNQEAGSKSSVFFIYLHPLLTIKHVPLCYPSR